jgi:hypothetical protein
MSDDGSERDLAEWTEREIFASNGHMEVESESIDGLSLVANYSNSTWGQMRTTWRFELSSDRITSVNATRVRVPLPRIPAAPARGRGARDRPRHGLACQ